MTFEEYRVIQLLGAKSWANHGRFMHQLGIYLLAMIVGDGLMLARCAFMAFAKQHELVGLLALSGAIFALGFAAVFARCPARRQQACLLKRQECLDSLSRIEKAFEEAEDTE